MSSDSPVPPRPQLPPNRLKSGLAAGRRQIGLWAVLSSTIATEILAGAGFDWIVIDMEHGPNDLPDVLAQLHAMSATATEPIVRCAANDAVVIKRVLDIGARSLLVPFVQDAAEAQRAVAAARYPPLGIRGVSTVPRANLYGRIAGYHATAHEQTCVVVQVETRTALENLEAIARVDGVDAVFIGPSDLAADMGHLGDVQHPDVQHAFADVSRRLRAVGMPAGILAPDIENATRYLGMGFQFVGVGSDVGLLAKSAGQIVDHFKKIS